MGSVARSIIDAVAVHGATTVFGLPGVHNLAFWKVPEGAPLVVRHEQAAVYAADGWARATGRLGELHVKVGHGRDYDDVCPFRGVHHGHSDVELEAAVEIRKGEAMLPGGLFTLMDSWSDTPGSPLRVTLGARAPVSMPALEQEQQQQQQQQ